MTVDDQAKVEPVQDDKDKIIADLESKLEIKQREISGIDKKVNELSKTLAEREAEQKEYEKLLDPDSLENKAKSAKTDKDREYYEMLIKQKEMEQKLSAFEKQQSDFAEKENRLKRADELKKVLSEKELNLPLEWLSKMSPEEAENAISSFEESINLVKDKYKGLGNKPPESKKSSSVQDMSKMTIEEKRAYLSNKYEM